MERVTRQYFCDVCGKDITKIGHYNSISINLTKDVGVSMKSKAWSELCVACYDRLDQMVSNIITAFPLYKKQDDVIGSLV